ncbi:uncharacterized protein PGTG_21006 [Puccinia graminis f. sp. tritici CRL 75-36-700-3]|uniref:DUF659 domain-containing protein n=1 Tax=Puccinia graminis f. sp. tritici (strain CRL 75-36-700-3 / race SCCL) TaxID=418459 RepID=H6QQ54_PUCGT|nr:uncharacterized protein PGTG_21006 [Puccinia graminis f. sp. tritici CRL 75-36-700-3]EHS64655.1 hypothetical protein PGTG_21006 [Puccinia graminis f. sp. tritici CRL 75-36-700-3]
MIAYPCKTCGTKIHRPVHDTSPKNLCKHVASCMKRQKEASENQKLSAFGISGTGDIDPREVPQLCAIWCAQSARPFSALGEQAHRGILHPVVVKNLPGRRSVSDDIGRLYTAVQESIIELLNDHKGAMYLGLDVWQSPNVFDVLGLVIYRLVEEGADFRLESMPLDFVKLQQSHTGVYLAVTVDLIVEKFGVKDKICGIVTDNASNNKTMIEDLRSYKWLRLKGEGQWIHCFAHIFNLIAQAILRPFGSNKHKNTAGTSPHEYLDSDNDETDVEPDDPDDQIKLEGISGDNDNEDDDAPLASNLIGDDEVELEDDHLNDLSDEGEEDQYTTQSCKESLSKFRAISRKLNKSPNSKALFKEICGDLECSTPHNITRDVCTRWNLTFEQLSGILQCSAAILEWQKDKCHGPARSHHINQNDLDLACDLVKLLQPFYKITLQVSTAGAARIADIVVFIDQITSHLSSAISDKRDDYPPAIRNACRAGLHITNKYYTLTDCSLLYRVAMVLHPSFKDKYFKLAQWEPEWIEESIRLTREMWENHYKTPPAPQATMSQ